MKAKRAVARLLRAWFSRSGVRVTIKLFWSEEQIKEKGLQIIKGKLYKMREAEHVAKEKGMQISSTTEVAWGNQIRSYVLHPYKMVKDHRTLVETAQVDKVLNGEMEEFIDAEKGI